MSTVFPTERTLGGSTLSRPVEGTIVATEGPAMCSSPRLLALIVSVAQLLA